MNADNETKRIQASERPFSITDSTSPDWRIWFGTGITVAWLIMLALYVSNTIGWANIGDAPIQILGNFLEGAFAPLAFLWLVIGYFLQKKELAQNTDAIKMQYIEIQKSAAQAEIQSEAIKQQEMHARKESFLRIAESVKMQLGSIMGFLFLSSQGGNQGYVGAERVGELWSKMSQNDPESFSRETLLLLSNHEVSYCYKFFYGTEVRTRHCNNFIFNFERLIELANDSDPDGLIRDAIMGSAHGFIYERMLHYRDEPPPGFTYGVYDFDPDSVD